MVSDHALSAPITSFTLRTPEAIWLSIEQLLKKVNIYIKYSTVIKILHSLEMRFQMRSAFFEIRGPIFRWHIVSLKDYNLAASGIRLLLYLRFPVQCVIIHGLTKFFKIVMFLAGICHQLYEGGKKKYNAPLLGESKRRLYPKTPSYLCQIQNQQQSL